MAIQRVAPTQYFETEIPQNNQVNYLPWFIIGALIFGGLCVVAIAYKK